MSELFQQLADSGLDFTRPRLYIVDGSRALRCAIHRHAGNPAFLQRCQIHKLRNVAEYLPESERPRLKFRMRAAYAKPEFADARDALYQLHDDLARSHRPRPTASWRGWRKRSPCTNWACVAA